ncbi:unnamed protein product [Adineta steineri]|uniref:ERAP1-like C-terminal domain-containing protein n=1 Tax=Adineta steineri TaxID=433720 RepID=A0A814AA20_9BILA|nr:unnamed protein product [Adineta steineri]
MDKPEITITLENISEDDWTKLNYNSIGLYRVKYEPKTLARLNEPIANKTLSPQDRLMVQNDVAALCNAGHQSFVDYLKLLLSYKDEDNFTVWKSIASTIGDLSSLLEYTDYFNQFKNYRLNLCSSIQSKIGWDAKLNENPLVAMLRPIILTLMGKSGDQTIIDEAKNRFQQHINGNLIDPNIRPAVYVVVSHYGDENTQEELQKLYKTADINEEKVRLLTAMGQSLNPASIEKTLQFVFEGDNVRMQDAYIGIAGCASSRVGRDIVWKFLQNNWTKLVERFGESSVFLIYFVESCLSNFADEKLVSEIESFFHSANTSTVTLALKQVIETIKMRSNVLKRDSKAIEEYLSQQ